MFDVLNYEKIFNSNEQNNVAFLCENKTNEPIIITNNNSEYTNKQHFKEIHNMHQGGTIVLFPQDIIFTWLSQKSILDNLLTLIYNHMCDKHIQVVYEGNDMLLDDKKIFGTMSYVRDGVYYEGLFLSFNSDINVIKTICRKPMVKTPINMPIDIKRDDLLNIISTFCEENNLNISGGDE